MREAAIVEFKEGRPSLKPGWEKYYEFWFQDFDHWGVQPNGQEDFLFRNEGGKFVDVSKQAGIKGRGDGLAANWCDYDLDGHIDLWVSNDFISPDQFLRNNGDGTFKDIAPEVAPHISWFSMGADTGDLNNDGLPDILTADMSATNHFKQKVTMGAMGGQSFKRAVGSLPPQYMRNALLVNASGSAGTALVLWFYLFSPNLNDIFERFIPDQPLGVLLVGAVFFAMWNAAVEEIAYRGVLMESLWVGYGSTAVALAGQALAFGTLHMRIPSRCGWNRPGNRLRFHDGVSTDAFERNASALGRPCRHRPDHHWDLVATGPLASFARERQQDIGTLAGTDDERRFAIPFLDNLQFDDGGILFDRLTTNTHGLGFGFGPHQHGFGFDFRLLLDEFRFRGLLLLNHFLFDRFLEFVGQIDILDDDVLHYEKVANLFPRQVQRDDFDRLTFLYDLFRGLRCRRFLHRFLNARRDQSIHRIAGVLLIDGDH